MLKAFFAFAFVFLLCCGKTTWAQYFEPKLQPKWYQSPSGEYQFLVNPGKRNGSGDASYRLSRNGQDVWSRSYTFTLWDAVVSDSGVAMGFGYTEGSIGVGSFVVAILGPDGELRLQDTLRQKMSRYHHFPPNPSANGIILHDKFDSFIVRVADPNVNRSIECWWVYSFSDARRIEEFEPKSHMENSTAVRRCVAADSVPERPLIFTHWLSINRPTVGARFALVDFKGDVVWYRDFPDDYGLLGDRTRDDVEETGAILSPNNPGEFRFRTSKLNEVITCSVNRIADVWEVQELSREKYEVHSSPEPPSVVEGILLEPLGNFTLGPEKGLNNNLRSILDFDFDNQGRIGVFGRYWDESRGFELLDQVGDVVDEFSFAKLPLNEPGTVQCLWTCENRWIVIHSPFLSSGTGTTSRTWQLDLEKREWSEWVSLEAPAQFVNACGTSDGGFVGLCRNQHWQETLTKFDISGTSTWSVGQAFKDPKALVSPKDIVVTDKDEVVVLDVVRKSVQVFTEDGKHLRNISLATAWGQSPNYPSKLGLDRDNGFMVYDFRGKPPLWRMTTDGAVRGTLNPSYSDGREVGPLLRVNTSPDGKNWVCTGGSLVQLDDKGIANFAFGETTGRPNGVMVASHAYIDSRGYSYLVPENSFDVHVFDDYGRLAFVCRPKPQDYPRSARVVGITVDNRNRVAIGQERDFQRTGYLFFNSSGVREGFEVLDKSTKREKWQYLPGRNALWVVTHDSLILIDKDRGTETEVSRRLDGQWLAPIGFAVSVAPNGGIALVGNRALNSFDHTGQAVGMLALDRNSGPTVNIAYDGRWVWSIGKGELLQYDMVEGKVRTVWNVNFDGPVSRYFPFVTLRGKELWILDRITLRVQRFALPTNR